LTIAKRASDGRFASDSGKFGRVDGGRRLTPPSASVAAAYRPPKSRATSSLRDCVGVTTAVPQKAADLPRRGGLKRTLLQTVDFPPGYQTVSVIAEIEPGTCAGRHTHPGAESTYIMEGEIVLKVEGKPDQVIKAGSSFQLPPGVVHDACNMSGRTR